MKIREEALLYAIGEIDDRFVAEAAAPERKAHTGVRRWMKWGLAACLVLVLVVSVPALLRSGGSSGSSSDGAGEMQPMIYVNDTIYSISAEEPYDSYQSGFVYLGEITDAVSSYEYPEEELQSNDGELVGAAVYQYGEDLVVCIDGQYWVYEPMGE